MDLPMAIDSGDGARAAPAEGLSLTDEIEDVIEIIAKDTESDRFQPIDDINHVHFAPILSVPSNQVPNQTSPVFGLSNNQHLITPSNTMPAQPSSRTTTQMNYPAETIIIEQPASKALRFRYECEGRSAGSIPGVKSTPENKTYPTIQVRGYQGRAVVVVSCVTKDPPHRPHPHNLVGKEGCKKGVCTLEINNKDMTVSFSNLGIQCVKKRDIEDALKQREEIRVDPFRTGFSHKTQPSSVDLNVVRLCFQVFLEGDKGKFTRPLAPVVSEPIYDKKAMSDLVICKLSDCSCPVTGNRDMILLCEKVAKEDIAVKFYEEQNGQVVWKAFGDFQHSAVHKQVAIAFKIPPYKTTQVKQPVECFIQLVRPSDGVVSEPLRFNYTPIEEFRGKKRPRMSGDTTDMFHKVLEQIPPDDRNPYRNISPAGPSVKAEPRETPSPFIPVQHYGGSMYENYRTNQTTPSPQPPTLQPQQPLPFSLSPQPTIPTHFTTNQFPQAFQQDPTFHQIASQLPPLIGNYITPVPMDIQSQQLHQIQQPGPLPPQAQMLPNQNNPTNNNNNPFQQDSINNIEPLDYFQINSSEIRNLLNDGNFSTLNSGQQQQNANPRAQDPDEECISDSLNKIL